MKGFEEIFEIFDSLIFRKTALRFDLLFESSSVAEFVDEVVIIGGFEDLDEAYNMGGVLYFGQGLDFVDGELFQFGAHFKLLDFDDFDGD